ncbi:MAG: acyl-CoA dehydrogenase family protein, partial [Leptospiraceae bacterium]|nr:acyl-CoA dehydrogenase family protein [Leptospiraceae bacterium]
MIKSNYFTDNEDLQLHVDRFIDWNELVELYEDGFKDAQEYERTGNERLAYAPSNVSEAVEYYKEIFNGYGDLAGNEVSQIAQDMDARGLEFQDGKVIYPEEIEAIYHKFHDAGLAATNYKRKYGGLGLPQVAKAISHEILYRADSSIGIALACVNLAAILEVYADEDMRNTWIPRLIEGKYTVTMGLTEPDYGSDLPAVKTKAEQIDGKWYLTGVKRFQTMACGMNGSPGVILALARTGDSDSGARGLSFFLVESKNYEVLGIE